MKLKLFRLASVAVLLGWMLLIFSLSNETAAISSQTSGGFSKLLLSLFYPPFNSLSPAQQQAFIAEISNLVRKSAHFTIYGLLGIFSLLSVISYRRIPYILRAAIALCICTVYAASDEWHQTLIAGRSGELRDVIIDSMGALLFITISILISRLNGSLWSRVKQTRKCQL